MHGRWFICHTTLTQAFKKIPSALRLRRDVSLFCTGWLIRMYETLFKWGQKKQMFCFQHEPLFCSVRSYGMCTQVSELLTSVYCQCDAPIEFTIMWSTCQNADVWSVSPCWVLLEYLNMKRCIQRLLWWYQKAEVQTMLCLWKYKDVSFDVITEWWSLREHMIFSPETTFFFFLVLSLLDKVFINCSVVVWGNMYNFCS